MDEEKMQRQMEFIVEQQAQFAAKIGQLEDNLARQGEAVERLNRAVELQGENIERVVGVIERFADSVTRLVQVTAERFEETDRKIAALVDAQIRTEEEARKREAAMRKLTETVDRHITDGHGGKERPEG
jgi:uncharacterized protein YoxC